MQNNIVCVRQRIRVWNPWFSVLEGAGRESNLLCECWLRPKCVIWRLNGLMWEVCSIVASLLLAHFSYSVRQSCLSCEDFVVGEILCSILFVFTFGQDASHRLVVGYTLHARWIRYGTDRFFFLGLRSCSYLIYLYWGSLLDLLYHLVSLLVTILAFPELYLGTYRLQLVVSVLAYHNVH